MKNLDKAFKNTQEERYLLADLILRKLNDKKLLQILNMGHKTSDKNTLKELISMSTHPYLTWFLSSKLSMITGIPRNKMSATMMYNPKKGKDMRMIRRNPVRLHKTFKPDTYYTNFKNLPKEAQKILLDTPVEVESSSYTVYESTAFIRNEVSFDDRYFEAEITLGSVDIKDSDYEYDDELDEYVDDEGEVIDSEEYAESMAQELPSYVEIENLNVYLTEIDPPRVKNNPSHEEHRDTMRKLYDMARASARGTLDIRLLDIAHGAVRIDELDHVLEQCDDKKVCDYAAYKKAFFIDKKMTKNNPYPGTYPKIDCFFDGEYLHSTNHYKTCREAKEGALEHFRRIIKNNNAGYSSNTIAKYKKILSQPEKLKCYFDRN